jgi:Ca2+-dependent lipid-binding protein
MCLNEALFKDNGGCGYVLKPEILTNPSLKFDPTNPNSTPNKKCIEIKIISAQNLPMNEDIVKDISDPYVVVSIFGIPADSAEKKTARIKDNGFNPSWNEEFKFTVNCPELAFLKFTVKDQDFGKDQLIGQFTIRFENIREGYRHVKLINKASKGTLFVFIKISPTKSSLNHLMKQMTVIS